MIRHTLFSSDSLVSTPDKIETVLSILIRDHIIFCLEEEKDYHNYPLDPPCLELCDLYSTVMFLCPRRNFGWHIKIALSVSPSVRYKSCLSDIS